MHESFWRHRRNNSLHPSYQPFNVRKLPVNGGHQLYVEQCGASQGLPVLCLHGGPGAGCSPPMRRFFDPKVFHVILFDQRGCGKSTPKASVTANTTQHLISDIEHIRDTLGIERWIIFGGSWGATLALLYAQKHPETVIHLVLRAIFLMMQRELDWFYGGGAGQFWPEHWQRFKTAIPQSEQADLITAYHRRLFSGNGAEEIKFGRLWHQWESALCKMDSPPKDSHHFPTDDYARTFSRLENHYFINRGFLQHDTQILDNMSKLQSVPGTIVHGRYDIVCPPNSAWELAKAWPSSELNFVMAGHALSEPALQKKLVSTMNDLRGIRI